MLLAMIACLCACARYSGDGQWVDRGWMSYSFRYLLDLGPVDLTRTGQQCFALAGLPRAEFSTGIDILERESLTVSGPRPDHAVTVHLRLTTEADEVVIDDARPLSAWTRQTPVDSPLSGRLYLRGRSIEHPLADGGPGAERIDMKAHGGWGSYFESERGARYRVCLSVLSTELAEPIPARLTLVGG
jgi:hypothetical protein